MSEIISKNEKIDNLRVAADKHNISAEDRKRNVKKLAGAISHGLRVNGEINARAFGDPQIGKAAKALAIAKTFILETHNLKLSFSPAYINIEEDGNKFTGISFCAFASPDDEDETPLEDIESVLLVKGDPRDLDYRKKNENVKKLAGAIAHCIEENGECVVRCIGSAAIGKASKALAMARGFIATKGPDMYCSSEFIVADIGGQEKTGIAFRVFTNYSN